MDKAFDYQTEGFEFDSHRLQLLLSGEIDSHLPTDYGGVLARIFGRRHKAISKQKNMCAAESENYVPISPTKDLYVSFKF